MASPKYNTRLDGEFRQKSTQWCLENYTLEKDAILSRDSVRRHFRMSFGQVEAAQIGKIINATFPGLAQVRRGPRGCTARQYVGIRKTISTENCVELDENFPHDEVSAKTNCVQALSPVLSSNVNGSEISHSRPNFNQILKVGEQSSECTKPSLQETFRQNCIKWLRQKYISEEGSMTPRNILRDEFRTMFGNVEAAQIGKIVRRAFPSIVVVRRGPRSGTKRQYVNIRRSVEAKDNLEIDENSSPAEKASAEIALEHDKTMAGVLPAKMRRTKNPGLGLKGSNLKKNIQVREVALLTEQVQKNNDDTCMGDGPATQKEGLANARTCRAGETYLPELLGCSAVENLQDGTINNLNARTSVRVCRLRRQSNQNRADYYKRVDLSFKPDGLHVIDAGIKGRGVAAKKIFQKGDLVCVYGGKLVTNGAEVIETFQTTNRDYPNAISYVFEIRHNGKNICLDASKEDGTFGRLINHSRKNFNLRPKKVFWGTSLNIGFYASRTIKTGEELLYDYGTNNSHISWLNE